MINKIQVLNSRMSKVFDISRDLTYIFDKTMELTKEKPRKIKLNIFLDEYFIPGYTGYVPRYMYVNQGKTYGETTRQIIKANPKVAARLMPLSHGLQNLSEKIAKKERAAGDYKNEKSVISDFSDDADSEESEEFSKKKKHKCRKHKTRRGHHKKASGDAESKGKKLKISKNDEKFQSSLKAIKEVAKAQDTQSIKTKQENRSERTHEFSVPGTPVYMKPVHSSLSLPYIPGYMGHIPGCNHIFGQTFGTTTRRVLNRANRKKKRHPPNPPKRFVLSNIFEGEYDS